MRLLIEELRDDFKQKLSTSATTKDVEELKVRFLGRKGPIQDLMKGLRDVSAEERPLIGKEINRLKEELEAALAEKSCQFLREEESLKLSQESLDVTLPGRRMRQGRKHLVTQVLDRMNAICIEMGFSVQYGPSIDTDYYNFGSLNIPEDHPARGMQDTFWLEGGFLLRTHTSNIQARVMEANKPPIRVIAPGKVFRNEEITGRSHVFFHQVEGLYIDQNVSLADLLATMDQLFKKLFSEKVQVRYRPSYFPFVEPGVEVDISCLNCNSEGCSLCKQTGWLEVAGAGMVHPQVLKNGGIDPEVYSGYAWGMGIERLVMLLHGIDDIRLFVQNDMRFLSQFSEV